MSQLHQQRGQNQLALGLSIGKMHCWSAGYPHQVTRRLFGTRKGGGRVDMGWGKKEGLAGELGLGGGGDSPTEAATESHAPSWAMLPGMGHFVSVSAQQQAQIQGDLLAQVELDTGLGNWFSLTLRRLWWLLWPFRIQQLPSQHSTEHRIGLLVQSLLLLNPSRC